MKKNYCHKQMKRLKKMFADSELHFDGKIYKYPYMAAIINDETLKADCGGVVIGNNGEILITGLCHQM